MTNQTHNICDFLYNFWNLGKTYFAKKNKQEEQELLYAHLK